jgi:hypothetical protein
MASELTTEELRRVYPCGECHGEPDDEFPCESCGNDGTALPDGAAVEALSAIIAEREAAAEKRGRNRGRNHLHCDQCGGPSHVADDDGLFAPDTMADCITCGMPGMVEINESGNAYWKDDEDGKCNQANCSECHGEELADARQQGRAEGLREAAGRLYAEADKSCLKHATELASIASGLEGGGHE